jgi:hypothetical protein
VRSQLLQVVLQCGAPLLDEVLVSAVALHGVLFRPRRNEVAAVRQLQQVSQRLRAQPPGVLTRRFMNALNREHCSHDGLGPRKKSAWAGIIMPLHRVSLSNRGAMK